MDTLSAYLAGVDIAAIERQRLALLERVYVESFGHPAHKAMLLTHQTRVNEFYHHNPPGTEPGTDAQINELVDAVTGYRISKKYTKRKAS